MRARLFGGVSVVAMLIGWPLVASAADPAPTAESCQNDLLTTAEYAALLRAQRDAYEIAIARLRAQVKVLDAEIARLKAEAAARTPQNIP